MGGDWGQAMDGRRKPGLVGARRGDCGQDFESGEGQGLQVVNALFGNTVARVGAQCRSHHCLACRATRAVARNRRSWTTLSCRLVSSSSSTGPRQTCI